MIEARAMLSDDRLSMGARAFFVWVLTEAEQATGRSGRRYENVPLPAMSVMASAVRISLAQAKRYVFELKNLGYVKTVINGGRNPQSWHIDCDPNNPDFGPVITRERHSISKELEQERRASPRSVPPATEEEPPNEEGEDPCSDRSEMSPQDFSPSKQERDEVWDAICHTFNLDSNALTPSERGDLGKTVRELLDLRPEYRANRERVERAAAFLRTSWGKDVTMTHRALRNHWGEALAGARAQASAEAEKPRARSINDNPLV